MKRINSLLALITVTAILLSAASCSGGGAAPVGGTASGGNTESIPAGTGGDITTPPEGSIVRVTVTEGQSLTQVFKTLEENGVASFDSLLAVSESYDYSYYPLVALIASDENRCFRLEGYLFPDTYDFYVGEKPQDAIGRFLRNSEAKWSDDMRLRAAQLGYTEDKILTVASIIQREGAHPAEAANVAAVIYNRLKAGMQLQMDSTINYIENNVKPYLTDDINRYNSFYNTYKCAALPEGPICNPGLTAIMTALYPSDAEYMYFCHDAEGHYYYAVTYEEHLANVEKAGV